MSAMPGPDPELSPADRRGVWTIATAAVAVLVVLAPRYGYHRDELYFLEASRHLDVSYVDQPPFAPLTAGLSRVLFGDSLLGLRLFPALALGGLVLLTGRMARELGGGAVAQRLAALCVAVAPVFLISAHLAGPTCYDQLAWATVSLLVIRILRTGDDRGWLAVGVVVAAALWNKQTILLLLAGLAVGLLIHGQARLAASRWLWLGAAIPVVCYLPWIAWQARNGWPTAEMDANLRSEHSGLGPVLSFPVLQLLMPNPTLAPVWLAGLWGLWRREALRRYRAFATAYVVMGVVLLVAIPDRPYYLAGLFPMLFATGAGVLEQVIAGTGRLFRSGPVGRRALWRSTRAAATYVLVLGLVQLPLSLPVLPAHVLATVPLQKVNYDMGENIGWQEYVSQVATVYAGLPSIERAEATILTSNYGEAGAIDRYGGLYGLPAAYSGHNSYWWWGPPPELGTTTIAIGFDRQYLLQRFAQVRQAGTVQNSAGVDNDEQGAPIWLCLGRRGSWAQLWPGLRHYN